MKSLNIYNLYPHLFKSIVDWEKYLDDICDMGFNSIYINPFHYPGFSGSLYAVKDYYKFNEDFFEKNLSPEEQLKNFLNICKSRNLLVFMDLVVNHSSVDCVLTKDHINWYVLDENEDFKKPGAWENGQWVTWGDLASFDFDNSPDKENLWNYFYNLCAYYLEFGFNGFRCDAAYQVSSDFWQFLISKIKSNFQEVYFLAETLGCTPVQIQSLSACGFDYIFNSSKWWNFNDPWCLEQYELTRNIAPSISFPETHDTPRLMADLDKSVEQFLQRLYFSAVFSKGFMIPTGFEYGFTKKIDTSKTRYTDWEKTGKDFREKIKNILWIKNKFAPLHEESEIKIIEHNNWTNVFCFTKEWDNQYILICINKDISNKQKIVLNNNKEIFKKGKIKDFSPEKRIQGIMEKICCELNPCEIKIFADDDML